MFSKSVRRILSLGDSEESIEPIKNTSEKEPTHGNLTEDIVSTPSSQSENLPSSIRNEVDEVASRATQMVQVFSEENKCLRNQLGKCWLEIKHLQSVEKDLRNTQLMYDDLKNAFISREHKEKAMRLRLELEIAQLQNSNTELTEKLREAQGVISRRPKDELKQLKEGMNKRDKVVEQLQRDGKIAKTSLQNLERLLKRKSSEIIDLKRQLERSGCKLCDCKLEPNETKADKGNKHDTKKGICLDDLGQFSEPMLKSLCRDTRFHNNNSPSYQKLKSPNHSTEFDVSTCVPVLIEILKEKNSEIAVLRKEISQAKSRPTELPKENLLQNSDRMCRNSHEVHVKENDEMYPKCSNDERRYSDLENAIKSLHVQLAEKNAVIKILRCKYGENDVNGCQDYSNIDSSPFRSPSFTSQASSISSFQDSGIVTSSDCCNTEMSNNQDMKGVLKTETYPLREQEFEIRDDERTLTEQEEDRSIDHCWFV